MKTKVPVSICIVAHNEEEMIVDCLDSVVERAAEVIVVDADSTDKTAALIKKQFPSVILLSLPNNLNLNVNKMHSFEPATQDWLFYLDSDERFTESLWDEVTVAVKNKEVNGYRVGRKNIYLGKWLQYGGQYPELQPRLFRRGKGKFAMEHIHEYLQITGSVRDLHEPFIHFTYRSMGQFLRKWLWYADFQAEKWAKEGVRWSVVNHFRYGLLRPLGRFIQKYLILQGFRDGFMGFMVAWMQGAGEFAAYLKVYDYQTKP